MPIRVSCTDCGKKLSVRDELAGKKVKCPGCATVFVAEADDTETAVKTTAPRPSPAAMAKDKVSAKPMSKRPAPPPRDDDDAPDDRPVRGKARRDDDEDDDDSPARSRSKKGKKKAAGASLMGLWIALAGVVVLGGGIGAYFLFFAGPSGPAVQAKGDFPPGGAPNAQGNPGGGAVGQSALPELVPGDAWLFASVHADLWKAKALDGLRGQAGAKFEQSILNDFGVPFADIERLTFFSVGDFPQINPNVPPPTPPIVSLIHFRRAMDPTAVGDAFRKSSAGRDPTVSMQFMGERVAVIGPSPQVQTYKAQVGKKRAEGALQTALTQATTSKGVVATFVLPPQVIQQAGAMVQKAQPEFAVFLKAKAALATLDLGEQLSLKVTLVMEDAGSAQQAKKTLDGLLPLAGLMLAGAVPDKELAKGLQQVLSGLKVSEQGQDVSIAYQADGTTIANAIATAVSRVQGAAVATLDMNNLKQIGLAWHTNHAVSKSFPAPSSGRGLSWRVMILPYLEQENLFRQFKLDEAWDSPHNKKLIPLMPKVFESANRPAAKGMTYYQTFVGPNTAHPSAAQGAFMPAFKDGSSNTIIVAEAATPVEWTRPADIQVAPGAAISLGVSGPRGSLALFADGSVRYVPQTIQQQVLRWLIDPADGNVIPNF